MEKKQNRTTQTPRHNTAVNSNTPILQYSGGPTVKTPGKESAARPSPESMELPVSSRPENIKGVVLAAGRGMRMRQITRNVPKPLLPIANKPILEHIVDALLGAGITELLFIVQYRKEQIIEHFGHGKRFGANIAYLEQPEMKGTGEAAGFARDFVGDDNFLLIFGDIMTPPKNIPGVLETFRTHTPFMVLTVRHVDDPWNGAAVYVDDGVVQRIVEKPPQGSSTTNFDNAGIFAFSNDIFQLLDRIEISPRGEYELTDAVQMAIQRKLPVRAYELQGFWSNISSPEDLIATNDLLLAQSGKSFDVHPAAEVEADCFIGPNACVAAGCTVGSGARISNAIVNHDAVIGKNAVLDYVYVSENARLKPGTSLIGKPDKVLVVQGPD